MIFTVEQFNTAGERKKEAKKISETGVETQKDLENLAKETVKNVEEKSTEVVFAGESRLESAVKSAGGDENDLEEGRKDLEVVQGEIAKLRHETEEKVLGEEGVVKETKEEKGAETAGEEKELEEISNELDFVNDFIMRHESDLLDENKDIRDIDIGEVELDELKQNFYKILEYLKENKDKFFLFLSKVRNRKITEEFFDNICDQFKEEGIKPDFDSGIKEYEENLKKEGYPAEKIQKRLEIIKKKLKEEADKKRLNEINLLVNSEDLLSAIAAYNNLPKDFSYLRELEFKISRKIPDVFWEKINQSFDAALAMYSVLPENLDITIDLEKRLFDKALEEMTRSLSWDEKKKKLNEVFADYPEILLKMSTTYFEHSWTNEERLDLLLQTKEKKNKLSIIANVDGYLFPEKDGAPILFEAYYKHNKSKIVLDSDFFKDQLKTLSEDEKVELIDASTENLGGHVLFCEFTQELTVAGKNKVFDNLIKRDPYSLLDIVSENRLSDEQKKKLFDRLIDENPEFLFTHVKQAELSPEQKIKLADKLIEVNPEKVFNNLAIFDLGSTQILRLIDVLILKKPQLLLIEKDNRKIEFNEKQKNDLIKILVKTDPGFLFKEKEKLGLTAENVFELISKKENKREKNLAITAIFSSQLESDNYGFFDEMAQQPEEIKISETLKIFSEKYKISNKGKTIISLLTAKIYNEMSAQKDNVPLTDLILEVNERLLEYSEILELKEESPPEGLNASIGMEYEVTSSIAKEYQKSQNSDYVSDVLSISKSSNVGQGADAVHEIATKPTDNPYLMLLEMKLLSDINFLDFNFSEYPLAGRSFHLTLGGEQELKNTENTKFLLNVLAMSNWAGVNMGKEVDRLNEAGSVIRERGIGGHNVQVFTENTNSIELRYLSIDKVEPFERTVLTANHAAIAIQAVEKYTNFTAEKLADIKKDFPDNPDALNELLSQKGMLKESIDDPKIKEIIYSWLKLQTEVSASVDDHNENFLSNETSGYVDDNGLFIDPSDFRGEDNKNRFKFGVKTLLKRDISLEDYVDQELKIENSSLFEEMTLRLANQFTSINNLFSKGDLPNAISMLDATKERGKKRPESDNEALKKSLFDRKGETRDGYYNLQGGSERLIVHRIQRLLLDFNKQMSKTLGEKKK